MNKKEIGQSMPNRHVVSKLKNCDQGFARSNGLFYQAVAGTRRLSCTYNVVD